MVYPTLDLEKQLWGKGYRFVCGVDEVGRGCFAGPVVAGAVVFSQNCEILEGIADSKLLKPKQRESLSEKIMQNALFFAVSEVSVAVINKVGIGKATQMAFRKAIKILAKQPDFVLIDAFYIKHLNRKKQRAVKDGDKICASISAASIIAKVYRDRLMGELHKKFPQYGFSKNKGYGTKVHQKAIKIHGLSSIHRRSFNLGKFL